jgi:hypothetical protein
LYIPAGQLAQPGAPGNTLAGSGVNPDVIDLMVLTQGYDIHPFQDIVPAMRFPEQDILLAGAGLERAREVQATMAALSALDIRRAWCLLPHSA